MKREKETKKTRWYTSADLLEKWSMQPFELIALIRNESLQPYLKNAEKEKKIKQQLTDDEVYSMFNAIEKRQDLPRTIINRLSPDIQLEHFDEGVFENGLQLQEFLDKLIFKAEDINNYKNQTAAFHDANEFIRHLTIRYVNTYSIALTIEGKSEQIFTSTEMGFKTTAKTWKMFMEVLTNRSHQYNVGKYDKDRIPENNRNYNNLVKNMSLFSQKFVAFLNKQYSLSLPKNLNVFKNMNLLGVTRPGEYAPKFRIDDAEVKINMSEKLDEKKCPEAVEDISKEVREIFSDEAKKVSYNSTRHHKQD